MRSCPAQSTAAKSPIPPDLFPFNLALELTQWPIALVDTITASKIEHPTVFGARQYQIIQGEMGNIRHLVGATAVIYPNIRAGTRTPRALRR
jgi:hypothetical protein